MVGYSRFIEIAATLRHALENIA
eukprot:COSAG02_NODE_36276_length_456_cov_4.661064_1_plen_22_part_10